MGVVIGTNAGFVSAAPSADPDGSGYNCGSYLYAQKDTSPAGSNNVSELGWYQSQSDNNASAYQVGIYSHDATNNRPNVPVGSIASGQSLTGSSPGWYKYTSLSIGISASTTYWPAIGVPFGGWGAKLDCSSASGKRYAFYTDSAGTLDNPWSSSTTLVNDYAVAIYAKYVAAGGPVSVSATCASRTLTDYNATVSLNVAVAASSDSLSITKYSTTVVTNRNVLVLFDELAITERAATVLTNRDVLAFVDELDIIEHAANVEVIIGVSAEGDTLVITENAATVTYSVNLAASCDELAVTENTATIAYDIAIVGTTDALTLTANQTGVGLNVGVFATAGALTLSTCDVAISEDINVTAQFNELVVTRYEAGVSILFNTLCQLKELSLTSYNAIVDAALNVSAESDTRTLATYDAAVDAEINVVASVEGLVLAEHAVDVGLDAYISSGVINLALTPCAAMLSYNVNVLASTDDLALATNAASLEENTNVLVTHAALTLTANQPVVAFDVNLTATAIAITLSTHNAEIAEDLSISAQHKSLLISTQASSVLLDSAVSVDAKQLTMATYEALLSCSVGVSAIPGSLNLTTYGAGVAAGMGVLASVENLELTDYAALVMYDVNLVASLDTLTIEEYSADVDISASVLATIATLTVTEYSAAVATAGPVIPQVIPVSVPVPTTAFRGLPAANDPKFLQAVKELLEVMTGQRGAEEDRVITVADLVNPSLVRYLNDQDVSVTRPEEAIVPSEVPLPPRDLELVTVDDPTRINAFNHHLTWTLPTDPTISGTEIWVSVGTNSRTNATRIGIVTAPQHEYIYQNFDITEHHYYWIRTFNWAGNYSTWEPTPAAGGYLVTKQDSISTAVQKIMSTLKGEAPDAWSDATAYITGDQVSYVCADGSTRVYEALQNGTNKNPVTETTYWERMGILVSGDVDGVPTVGIDGNMVVDGTIITRNLDADCITAEKIAADAIEAGHISIGASAEINPELPDDQNLLMHLAFEDGAVPFTAAGIYTDSSGRGAVFNPMTGAGLALSPITTTDYPGIVGGGAAVANTVAFSVPDATGAALVTGAVAGSTHFCWSFWHKRVEAYSHNADYQVLMSTYGSAGAYGVYFYQHQLGVYDGSFTGFGWTPTDGVWYHIVLDFIHNTSVSLWVDHVFIQTVPFSRTSRPASFGNYISGGEFGVPGIFDELRVYKQALTEEQIHALHKYPEGHGKVANSWQSLPEGDTFGKMPKAWKHGSDTTKIDGGNIYTGTVVADAVYTTSLSALSANLGMITAGLAKSSDGKIQVDFDNKWIKVWDANNILRVHLGYIP